CVARKNFVKQGVDVSQVINDDHGNTHVGRQMPKQLCIGVEPTSRTAYANDGKVVRYVLNSHGGQSCVCRSCCTLEGNTPGGPDNRLPGERSALNSMHSEKTSDKNYNDNDADDIKDIHDFLLMLAWKRIVISGRHSRVFI